MQERTENTGESTRDTETSFAVAEYSTCLWLKCPKKYVRLIRRILYDSFDRSDSPDEQAAILFLIGKIEAQIYLLPTEDVIDTL